MSREYLGAAQAGDPHKAAAPGRTTNSTVAILCCTVLIYFKEGRYKVGMLVKLPFYRNADSTSVLFLIFQRFFREKN